MSHLQEYIKNAYPYWIRDDANTPWTLTSKYDEVRAFTLWDIETNIAFVSKQLNVSTATVEWITEWENFLKIYNPNRTLEERRGQLLSRITWANSTLSLMKSIIYSVVGGSSLTVQFLEYWTIWATWDDVFIYEVIINSNFVSIDFDTITLRVILELLQPAHCTVVITITNDLVDAISTTDILAWNLLTSHTWGDWTWSITWGTWNPETWYIWGV